MDRPLQWLPDQSGRPTSSFSQYAACSQAGALGPIADRPFTLRMYLEEDLGCPLWFGRPPGMLVDRGGGPSRSVLWTTDALQFGFVHPIASSYNSACNQAGALGSLTDRPFNPLKVKEMMVLGRTLYWFKDYGNMQQLLKGKKLKYGFDSCCDPDHKSCGPDHNRTAAAGPQPNRKSCGPDRKQRMGCHARSRILAHASTVTKVPTKTRKTEQNHGAPRVMRIAPQPRVSIERRLAISKGRVYGQPTLEIPSQVPEVA
ncbi:hypothetical protein THAOC_05962 [Thalassiosira oceanica]|uniref:Uncharacterized protein n=1 Tax=Thalassiosira oceanica TaxID=159749 RepID=K0T483_THAOC|nr:hypothetical protein THAOC_05962 [Thalassiosira oceanica]|eukprot:EJK72510.1 hypothetical protein THAOC_05962 [Thalassiosira oceanica]